MTRRVAFVAVVCLSVSAHAAVECTNSEATRARLAKLSTLFVEESDAAKRWTLGWGAGYAALTAAQLGVMSLFPRDEQPDWYWGAVSSGVGVPFVLLGPLEVMEAGPRFAQRAKASDTLSDEQACALLVEGEKMLRDGAEQERGNRAWFLHIGNVLFNAGTLLVLGLGYQHWVSGLINALVGTAIGELTMFTGPNRLMAALAGDDGSAPKVTFHIVPTAGPGLGLVVRF